MGTPCCHEGDVGDRGGGRRGQPRRDGGSGEVGADCPRLRFASLCCALMHPRDLRWVAYVLLLCFLFRGLCVCVCVCLLFRARCGVVTFSELLLPVLTSECPGWICYAEKRHPESLPYISTVKSAQEIMGTFVKFGVASRCVLAWYVRACASLRLCPFWLLPCVGCPASGTLQWPSSPCSVSADSLIFRDVFCLR